MEQDIIDKYRQGIAAAQLEVNKYKDLINTYSFLRLAIFVMLFIIIYIATQLNNFTLIAITFVVLLFCFLWLVSKQSGFEQQKKYFENLLKLNQNETDNILSHANLYSNGPQYGSEQHFYSLDLDIFGGASLYHLINRCATILGNNKLAAWLNAPAPKQTVLSRQEAVKELSAKNNWRLETQAKLLFAAKAHDNDMPRLLAI